MTVSKWNPIPTAHINDTFIERPHMIPGKKEKNNFQQKRKPKAFGNIKMAASRRAYNWSEYIIRLDEKARETN